jgi:hypothetical protein
VHRRKYFLQKSQGLECKNSTNLVEGLPAPKAPLCGRQAGVKSNKGKNRGSGVLRQVEVDTQA